MRKPLIACIALTVSMLNSSPSKADLRESVLILLAIRVLGAVALNLAADAIYNQARAAVCPNGSPYRDQFPGALPYLDCGSYQQSSTRDTDTKSRTYREPNHEATDYYAQGVADWHVVKDWLDSQTGDRRRGSNYWAANRNVGGHPSCDRAANYYSADSRMASAFADGCLGAKLLLDPIDMWRRNQEYRTGFNNEAQRFPLLQ